MFKRFGPFIAVVLVAVVFSIIILVQGMEIQRLRAATEVGPTHTFAVEAGEYRFVDYVFVQPDGRMTYLSCGFEDKGVMVGHRLMDADNKVVGVVVPKNPTE